MKYHPDRNPGDQAAEEKFKEAAEAYADPRRRREAQPVRSLRPRGRRAPAGGGAGFDPSVFSEFGDFADILGNMFGFGDLFGGGAPPRRSAARRRSALRPRDHVRGIGARRRDARFRFRGRKTARPATDRARRRARRRRTCPQCRGQGQVRFQQGFFTVARTCPQCRGAGTIITKPCTTLPRRRPRDARAQDHRQDSRRASPPASSCGCRARAKRASAGGPAGHLYVVVHVQEHEFFRRDGINLFCEIPVNFTTLALGGEIQVPTLDGTETVKVPEGTQTGTTLRLRGKGMPDVNGRGRGDLFATVQVQTPKKLTQGTAAAARAAREGAAEGEIRAARARRRSRTSATCSIASRTCSGNVKDWDPAIEAYPALEIRAADPDRLSPSIDDFVPPRSKNARTRSACSSRRRRARDAPARARSGIPSHRHRRPRRRLGSAVAGRFQPITVGRTARFLRHRRQLS